MNMNLGIPNSAPTYRKATLEEYQRSSFIPTKANLEKQRLGHEQTELQDRHQGKQNVHRAARSITDHDVGERRSSDSDVDPHSTATSNSLRERPSSQSYSQPEVRRLSGNFNAPTQVEVDRHNETKRSLRGKIKDWLGRSPPETVA